MQRTIKTVKLICLGSKDYTDSLVCLLQQLVNVHSLIDAECWLEGQIKEPNLLIILALPENNLLVDKIFKAMLATPNAHYLVIFFPPLTDQISSILNTAAIVAVGLVIHSSLHFVWIDCHRVLVTQLI